MLLSEGRVAVVVMREPPGCGLPAAYSGAGLSRKAINSSVAAGLFRRGAFQKSNQ